MPSLLTPITTLKGLPSEAASKFKGLGLETLQDALFHFPIRHQDWRRVVTIRALQPGDHITVLGTIVSVRGRRAWRRKTHLTEVIVTDASQGRLSVVWFNQPYLASWLKPGQRWFLSGKITAARNKLQMQQPMYDRPVDRPSHETLIPVYPATAGLSQWQIRKVLKLAIGCAKLLPELLPSAILNEYDLVGRAEALEQIHFPDSPETAERAVRRLKFEELLAWQLRWRKAQAAERKLTAPAIPFHSDDVRNFVQGLPFNLTADQRQAAWQIIQDLTKSEPMSRLLHGDVGSGKTVVAAIAAYHVIRHGYQVAALAPTLVLAQQHFETLKKIFQPVNVEIDLLTGQTQERETMHRQLAAGKLQLLVGTHALVQAPLPWHKLGLVIVDEQQRFGVDQRQALLDQQTSAGRLMPHFLSLTATPIPRTLALFFAGELALSQLRHKPPGRAPIVSKVLGPDQRRQVDAELRTVVARGEQVYVITPLIEENDALGVRAATTEFTRLQKAHPHFRIGLLHGSLPAETRLQALESFRLQQLDILVSTTVIEVGVDVPNATLMIIEGAERFGLAQLHQLRGRVGRSHKPSRCLLVTDQASESNLRRLNQVAATDDGLSLAEFDLEQRGMGDLYGLRQSGLPDWKLAGLQDRELMDLARQAADKMLKQYASRLNQSDWQQLISAELSWHRE